MRRCPYCSQSIDDESRRCMYCGRLVNYEALKKIEQEKANRRKVTKVTRTALVAILAIIVFTGIMIWAAVYGPDGYYAHQEATLTAEVRLTCGVNAVSTSASALIDFNNRWGDGVALALSAERSELAPQVERLQALRREARAQNVPDCLRTAKTSLVTGMDVQIEGLLAYLRDESRDRVNDFLSRGNLDMNAFADEVERVQRCAPDCW